MQSRKITLATIFAAVCIAGTAITAEALPVTAPVSGATQVTFPAVNRNTSDPVTLDANTVWSSTNRFGQSTSLFGWTNGYNFGPNGNWSGNPPMVGLNIGSNIRPNAVDAMTFAFTAPVAGVGGLVNWFPSQRPVTIEIFDSSLVLLESMVLSNADMNLEVPNAYYGFQRAINDISYFVLRDGYIGLRSFQYNAQPASVSPVPIPPSAALLATGLLGLLAFFKKKSQRH